jgi:hypothetical protein
MDTEVKYALVVAGIIVVLVILSKFTFRRTCSDFPEERHQNKKQYQKLVDEAKHWHETAKQDSNILMALVHATTALSKLNTLSGLSTVVKASKEIDGLKRKIQAYHNKVIAGFEDAAPEIALPVGTQCDLDWYIAAAAAPV